MLVLICARVTVVSAQILPAYPTTDPGPSAAAWFTDRYAPNAFANAGQLLGRGNVLLLGLAAADGQSSRPSAFSSSFYNTQGRKILVGAPTAGASWIGSLYIPSSWSAPSAVDGSLSRRSDLWATVSPTTGGDTCAGSACNQFPIIGFTNSKFPDQDNDVGGTPRYRVFDGDNGGWNDLPGVAVDYDAWTDFCVTFTGSTFEFRIGDKLVYTQTNLTQGDTTFGPVTNVNNVMVQAYNFGYTYDVNWSHLAAGAGTCAQLRALFGSPSGQTRSIPTLSGGPLAALGLMLGGCALLSLRRIERFATAGS